MNSILAVKSETNKKSNNQDCGIVFNNTKANIKGVVITDGIGSHYKAELAAEFCAKKFKELIEDIDNLAFFDLNQIFYQIKINLCLFANEKLSKSELFNNPFGTTLISCIELKDEIIIAYVGNGSAWHIYGNFNHFSANHYLPWNMTNLLIPHVVEQQGKPALYKYFSIDKNVSCKPSIIRITKNDDYGDIILITTDGVYSNDQQKVGKDETDTLWIMGEKNLIVLLNYLKTFFARKNYSSETLELLLEDYLKELKNTDLLYDDTTVGALITEKALIYNQNFV